MSMRWNTGKVLEVYRVEAWEIEDFFALALEPSCEVYSPEFTSGGATWCLDMVSSGKASNWIVLSLVKSKYSNDPVFPLLNVEIVLRRRDGTTYKSDTSGNPDLESVLEGRYFFWFRRSMIFQGRDAIAREGTMTAICKMSFGEKSSSEMESDVEACSKGKPSLTCTGKLAKDFKELLLSGHESNMVIRVSGEEFRAHRGILSARIPVFDSLFQPDKAENTEVAIIKDVKPGVFREFLHYVYTGALLGLSVDNVFGLYVVSDKYQVDELKAQCLDFIKRNLTTRTFYDAVTVALRHHEEELLQMSIDFFSRNMKNIIITVKWQKFLLENPIIANELLIKAICD